jgi:hypothetical protein
MCLGMIETAAALCACALECVPAAQRAICCWCARVPIVQRPPRRLSVFNGTYAIRKVENDCFLGIYACVPFSSSAWCALRRAAHRS